MGLRIIALVVVVVAAAPTAQAQPALDKPAFTAKPAELLAVAKTAPAGDWPIVILREDNDIAFDATGRKTYRTRLVYVIRSQVGVDEFSSIHHSWSPFYQDKPIVKARVVEPDGKVVQLDASLITDTPTISSSPTIYSDRRRLHAPLPRLSIGAIVEQQVVITDRVPVLAAGSVVHVDLGSGVPVVSSRARFSAPVSRKLRHVARNVPAKQAARHQVANGTESWTYELSLPQPQPWRELHSESTNGSPTDR